MYVEATVPDTTGLSVALLISTETLPTGLPPVAAVSVPVLVVTSGFGRFCPAPVTRPRNRPGAKPGVTALPTALPPCTWRSLTSAL
jgi:hypothetical protein